MDYENLLCMWAAQYERCAVDGIPPRIYGTFGRIFSRPNIRFCDGRPVGWMSHGDEYSGFYRNFFNLERVATYDEVVQEISAQESKLNTMALEEVL